MSAQHRSIGAAFVLALIQPLPVAAGFFSGNDLQSLCNSSDGVTQCIGYVMGIADAAERMGKACLRAGVEFPQVLDVTRAYLAAHPAARDKPGADLVLIAIREAWPCAKPK